MIGNHPFLDRNHTKTYYPKCYFFKGDVMLSILPIGCYGSDLDNKKCITMQISPTTIIDTGSLLSSLSTEDLLKIENVIITHSHFDHIKNLPIFADFMLSLANKQFNVYTTEVIKKQIMDHIFNNLIWPDFSALPTRSNPTIKFIPIEFEKQFTIDGIDFLPIEMNHIVESIGFIIRKGKNAVAYSGDTSYCDNFIDHVNADRDIKTLCWEVSFPDRLKSIAVASKHLSPSMLESELSKIKRNIPVHTFHLKPNLEEEITTELSQIKSNMPVMAMKQKKPIIIS